MHASKNLPYYSMVKLNKVIYNYRYFGYKLNYIIMHEVKNVYSNVITGK